MKTNFRTSSLDLNQLKREPNFLESQEKRRSVTSKSVIYDFVLLLFKMLSCVAFPSIISDCLS